jgi:hypothetical protein
MRPMYMEPGQLMNNNPCFRETENNHGLAPKTKTVILILSPVSEENKTQENSRCHSSE